MKNKFQKIITTAMLSAVSLTTIACGNCNNKIADKPINVMAENKTCSIHQTASAIAPQKQIGKIVETSTTENNDSTSFFIIASSPNMSLFNDDNNTLNIKINFLDEKAYTPINQAETEESKEKLNTLKQKQSILMIYANELYNNNVNLTTQNKVEIIAEINKLKNNSSTLNSIDSQIESIEKINNIIETNLSANSKYYQSNLNNLYNNLSSRISNNNIELNQNSSNQEIANKLLCTFGICENKNKMVNTTPSQPRISNNTESNLNNNNSLNQNQTSLNDQNNNLRRVPNSIRRRRNLRNNQNNLNTQDSNNQNLINQQNLNDIRNNNMQDNNKVLRADRSQDNTTNEEYSSQIINNNTATRVPYRTTNIYNK